MSDTPAPAVVLHSLGLVGSMYAALATALPGRAVYLPDLRGHGRAAAAAPVTLEAMADDVVLLLDSLHAEHGRAPHLVGHSLGGAVAGVVAARRPDLVETLTVVASPTVGLPAFSARAAEAESRGMTEQIEDTLHRWFADPHSPLALEARQCLEQMSVSAWAASWRSLAGFRGWSALALPAGLPLLCVSYAADRSTPPGTLAAIAQVSGGQHVAVDHGDHMTPLAEPQALATYLLEHWTRSQLTTKGSM